MSHQKSERAQISSTLSEQHNLHSIQEFNSLGDFKKKQTLYDIVKFSILSALIIISALDRLSSIVGYDVTVNQTLVSSARTRWYNNPYTLGSYSFPAVGKC